MNGQADDRYRVLGRWQGYVTEVGPDTFSAIISDQLGRAPDERVVVDLDEVSDEDRPLVQPGAVFYWTMSYHTEKGTRRLESVVLMQRLPAFTPANLRQAERWAHSLPWPESE